MQALIFDVDGTLADTERDGHQVAFNRAFADAGLDWYWDDALYARLLAVTGGKERIRHYIEAYDPPGVPEGDLDDFIRDLHEAKTRHFVRMMSDPGIPARPGVMRLFRQAREAGVRLAVATTTSPENVSSLLAHSFGPEVESWFEVIGAGDVVEAKKPAGDIYEYVLERMRLAPDQALAIEDSANGLRAATAAGLKTLITVADYTRGENFDGALAVFDHLGEAGNLPTQMAGPPLELAEDGLHLNHLQQLFSRGS